VTIALFPYDTLSGGEPPSLTISGVRLDAATCSHLVNKETSGVPLYGPELKPWTRLELDLELTGDPAVVREYENAHGRISAITVANCLPTNLRQPLDLTRSDVDPGRWSGTLELDRDNLRGRVALVTTLTGTVNGVRHRPVAFASGWTIYVDEPESLRLKGTLDVKWKNFRETDDQPAKDFPNSTHVVAFTGGVPELWLNSGFEGLEALLKDRKDRRGADKGLHDFQRTGIARSVWMALVADAVAAVRAESAEDDIAEPDWPEAPWQTEILKQVLPAIAPGKSERELLRLAAAEWRNHPGAAEFFSRAEVVVGDFVKANELLRRFVQSYRGEETT
jgi:hypothetical protein